MNKEEEATRPFELGPYLGLMKKNRTLALAVGGLSGGLTRL